MLLQTHSEGECKKKKNSCTLVLKLDNLYTCKKILNVNVKGIFDVNTDICSNLF